MVRDRDFLSTEDHHKVAYRLTKKFQYLSKAAQFHIRALRHTRQSLSKEMTCHVACAIVGAKLDYCNGILHGISTTNINKLQQVQNTLARVVTGGRKYDHITPVLKELHWLPIKHRIDFKLATIVYKVKPTQEPSYLAELLIDHNSNRNLQSNDCYLLERPRTRTALATRAFSVAAPNIWNCLPNILKTQDTIKEFKSKLKTHYRIYSFISPSYHKPTLFLFSHRSI